MTCWFGHRHWHRGRVNGQPVKVCDTCLQPFAPIMDAEVIRTPLPQVVSGQPTCRAQRVTKDNTVKFRQSER